MPQTTIRFGRPAPGRDDDDHMACVVLAHVLGGGTGLTSRLFREVREKRGLAYSASAAVAAFEQTSFLHGGTTTKNERAYESLEVIGNEILDLARGGITEDELEKGKRYLVGSYPLRFDTSTKIAGQLVNIQLEGHGPDLAGRAQRAHRRGDDGRRQARRRTHVRRRRAVGGDGREAEQGLRRRSGVPSRHEGRSSDPSSPTALFMSRAAHAGE